MLASTVDSAIRRFHYYRKYCSPKIEESFHERNNAFDIFAIKTCKEYG